MRNKIEVVRLALNLSFRFYLTSVFCFISETWTFENKTNLKSRWSFWSCCSLIHSKTIFDNLGRHASASSNIWKDTHTSLKHSRWRLDMHKITKIPCEIWKCVLHLRFTYKMSKITVQFDLQKWRKKISLALWMQVHKQDFYFF